VAGESFDELFDRARRAMKEGFAEQALVPATEAVKLSPDRWDARLLLARVWLAQRRPDRALSDVRTALTLGAGKIDDEGTRDAHEVIALASLAQGDAAAAKESLRVLVGREDSPRAVARLVALEMSQSRPPEAKAAALAAVGVHPALAARLRELAAALDLADAFAAERVLAELEIDVGLLDEARTRLQKLFARDPHDEALQESLRVVAAGGRPKTKRVAAAPAPGPANAPRPGDPLRRLSRIARTSALLLGLAGLALSISPARVAPMVGANPAQVVIVAGVLLLGAIILIVFDRRALRGPSSSS